MNRKGVQVIGAFAIIFNNKEEVLLGQRNEADSTHPFHQKWSMPGGGVEIGEHPEDTVKREIQEELGLEIELLTQNPIVISHMNSIDASEQNILLVYPAMYTSGIINVEADEETSDARWFDYNEIDF